ncbi:hypothetical protein QYM36_017359 [Artemia franciscana]|uniref:Coatomer subunit beta' n=1 Tax=Artemia franciscana TaxID=6661 RepID=A0AA88HD54_ARTSF|nr:hypothetical protein QYM36_017359 [Artemia franciscana]
MNLKLDYRHILTARSDRVKCVDLHPTEPWIPVRSGKFIARKNWIITGSDDYRIRVFNYNTLERQQVVDAHKDYVRCLAVHPTLPIVLSGSDDKKIKMRNWDNSWTCQKVFDGHSHYVMQIVFNPKDNNTFASASLDKTIKIWQLASSIPNFTLKGHVNYITCLDYTHAGQKPYLISGADDCLVKIWDYQNRSCVQSLYGHTENVTAVVFHPELPIIITGSEDGTVKIWNASTYSLENTLNYGLGRAFTICCLKGSNMVGIGFDDGCVMIRLGKEDPTFSMDEGGKILWIKNSEIEIVNLKQFANENIKDGERLNLSSKGDAKSSEVFANTLAHNSDGRYVAVCGGGEYIIYTAMALRNKAYGSALEFVWGIEPEGFAIRESTTTVKVFQKLTKEKKSLKVGADGIYGGTLLGVRFKYQLTFYCWDSLDLVIRTDIQPTGVFWSGNREMVAITTKENFYILHCDVSALAEASEEDRHHPNFPFDDIDEKQENVKTATWVGDCFIYLNSLNRLNYYVGGEIVTISYLDRPHYILGYIPRHNRIYLCDKELNVLSYSLHLSVLDFETSVMRKDIQNAQQLLPSIPRSYYTKIAHFLEKQGFVSQALSVSTDPDHKFDLALQLSKLDLAVELAREIGSDQKWRQLADCSILNGRLDLADKCYEATQDFGALLILRSSSGNLDKVAELAEMARSARKFNVAFTAYLLTHQNLKALDILVETNKLPDAAFFARTYLPSEVPRVTQLWKAEQQKSNAKAAQGIADPFEYTNLFPSFEESLQIQRYSEQSERIVPASQYSTRTSNNQRNVFEELSKAFTSGLNLEKN